VSDKPNLLDRLLRELNRVFAATAETPEDIPKLLWMSESLTIDSITGGYRCRSRTPVTCANALSMPLKQVRRGVRQPSILGSVSSVVKWVQRWQETRSAAPKPRGGSVSPLEKLADRVLAVVAEQPDLTLVETVAEPRRHRIRTSRSSLSRFFQGHEITFKKGLQAAERERADVARARRRWTREQGLLDPTRLVFP
jgi:transposase